MLIPRLWIRNEKKNTHFSQGEAEKQHTVRNTHHMPLYVPPTFTGSNLRRNDAVSHCTQGRPRQINSIHKISPFSSSLKRARVRRRMKWHTRTLCGHCQQSDPTHIHVHTHHYSPALSKSAPATLIHCGWTRPTVYTKRAKKMMMAKNCK